MNIKDLEVFFFPRVILCFALCFELLEVFVLCYFLSFPFSLLTPPPPPTLFLKLFFSKVFFSLPLLPFFLSFLPHATFVGLHHHRLMFCAPICYCATILHSCLLPCCYLAFSPYICHINVSHSNLLLCSYFALPSITTLLFHTPYLLLISTPHLLLLCTPHLLLFQNPHLLLHVSHCYQVLPRPLVTMHFSFATILHSLPIATLHSLPIVTFRSPPIVLRFSFKNVCCCFHPPCCFMAYYLPCASTTTSRSPFIFVGEGA